MEVKKGEQKISEKRIWPGYVLIKMNLTDDSWQYVKHTPGVIDFLGGEKPTSLSDQEVNSILKELEEKKSGVTQKHKIEVGDRVKINDGVFVNFIGTVIEVFQDKGRLSVMVSIFGRDTRVDDLEFWQIEEVGLETES
jgi:transcriptional antiterminator NusG